MNLPLPLEEAQAALLEPVRPLATERVPAQESAGRRLATTLFARRTQPWADLSAMDGFATAGSGPWKLVGESAAGHPFRGVLGPGQATRISTGAAVPAGADAILLVEDSRVDGQLVHAAAGLPSAQHIRPAGFDFAEGDTLLEVGTLLSPARLALAVASGAQSIEVFRKPRVAVLDTGDELARGLDDDRPDALPASNGPMIAALCSDLALAARRIGPVPDDAAALMAALGSVADADVIVTSGGASVGSHDLVRPVLEQWGASIAFWRVAIRPGKPVLVGRRRDQWIVGLPGNPVSAYVTALLFVLPLLRRLGGAPLGEATPRSIPMRLAGPVPAGGSRREFLRGRIVDGRVMPLAERDSSALRSLAAADCLIDRPAGADALNAGATVAILLLPGA